MFAWYFFFFPMPCQYNSSSFYFWSVTEFIAIQLFHFLANHLSLTNGSFHPKAASLPPTALPLCEKTLTVTSSPALVHMFLSPTQILSPYTLQKIMLPWIRQDTVFTKIEFSNLAFYYMIFCIGPSIIQFSFGNQFFIFIMCFDL